MGNRTAETFGRTAFIFDMDGTLLNSMSAWEENIRLLARRRGVELPDGFYRVYRAMTSWETAEHLISHWGVRGTVDELVQELARGIEGYYAGSIQAKPHARELLDAYRAQGVKLALLTGTERYLIELVLKRLDLLSCFDLTRSCREAGGSKSSPVPFRHVLDALGVGSGGAVLVDDSYHCLETASVLGIFTVGVQDGAFTDIEDRVRGASDRYIRTLDELFLP